MKSGDQVRLLKDYPGQGIEAGAVGIVRVPNRAEGKATVQFGVKVIICEHQHLKPLDMGRALTEADIEEVFAVRVADLEQAYLEASRRHFQAVATLKKQKRAALERLNGGTDTTEE